MYRAIGIVPSSRADKGVPPLSIVLYSCTCHWRQEGLGAKGGTAVEPRDAWLSSLIGPRVCEAGVIKGRRVSGFHPLNHTAVGFGVAPQPRGGGA